MYKGSKSRFFPILVIIIIAAIVIFGIVSIVRSLLPSNDGSQKKDPTVSLNSKLLNTDGDRSVSIEARGPIVGNEAFRSYEITISPTSRTITTWSGYNRSTVVDSESLPNNTKAYGQFVHALDYAGYTKTSPVKSDDTKGLCADGRVYNFVLASGADSIDNRWTTNCGVKGSFAGSGPSIRSLFLSQIPKAQDDISKIGL